MIIKKSEMNSETVWNLSDKIKQNRPLIHCITNIVTVNDCANILLAAGASPIMAHHPEEVEEVTQSSDSLVLNMAATECLKSMLLAGMRADMEKHPIVIDPVGVSGSTFRRESCLKLIQKVRPTCIRGNYAEIKAIALNQNTGKGVDECLAQELQSKDKNGLEKVIENYAREQKTIVIASGKTDFITNGYKSFSVNNGTELMARVTGTGCMSSALLGAFMAVEPDIEAAAAACFVMGICGEIARDKMQAQKGGIGTFHVELLNAVFNLTKDEIADRMIY